MLDLRDSVTMELKSIRWPLCIAYSDSEIINVTKCKIVYIVICLGKMLQLVLLFLNWIIIVINGVNIQYFHEIFASIKT